MDDNLETFLSSCTKTDFGDVHLTDQEKDFYTVFNREIISLCDSLPESVRGLALLFLMKYSGLSIGQDLDFFKNYYTPSWSVIYWLSQFSPNRERFSKEDIQNTITAQSMAMKLHSLDNHLNDQQVPASHLTLLLRSQSWTIMIKALKNLSCGIDSGERVVKDFLNDYYSGIIESKNVETLDSYCDLFKKQMATWLIVPVLMARKITTDEKFTCAVQAAYESFGIAWRLLDDIIDIGKDMKKGAHSAVYVCLSKKIKKLWETVNIEESNNQYAHYDIILEYILKNRLIDRIKNRIISELESAASISDSSQMTELAREFRCLLKPFRDSQDAI